MDFSEYKWVIIIVVVIIVIYLMSRGKGIAETFLSPFNIAPGQADLVELSMRRNMFAR